MSSAATDDNTASVAVPVTVAKPLPKSKRPVGPKPGVPKRHEKTLNKKDYWEQNYTSRFTKHLKALIMARQLRGKTKPLLKRIYHAIFTVRAHQAMTIANMDGRSTVTVSDLRFACELLADKYKPRVYFADKHKLDFDDLQYEGKRQEDNDKKEAKAKKDKEKKEKEKEKENKEGGEQKSEGSLQITEVPQKQQHKTKKGKKNKPIECDGDVEQDAEHKEHDEPDEKSPDSEVEAVESPQDTETEDRSKEHIESSQPNDKVGDSDTDVADAEEKEEDPVDKGESESEIEAGEVAEEKKDSEEDEHMEYEHEPEERQNQQQLENLKDPLDADYDDVEYIVRADATDSGIED